MDAEDKDGESDGLMATEGDTERADEPGVVGATEPAELEWEDTEVIVGVAGVPGVAGVAGKSVMVACGGGLD